MDDKGLLTASLDHYDFKGTVQTPQHFLPVTMLASLSLAPRADYNSLSQAKILTKLLDANQLLDLSCVTGHIHSQKSHPVSVPETGSIQFYYSIGPAMLNSGRYSDSRQYTVSGFSYSVLNKRFLQHRNRLDDPVPVHLPILSQHSKPLLKRQCLQHCNSLSLLTLFYLKKIAKNKLHVINKEFVQ